MLNRELRYGMVYRIRKAHLDRCRKGVIVANPPCQPQFTRKGLKMWWDIKQTLSYNALFNFVVGNRGGGKTYGFKKWAIEDFIKTGKQFVYVRRYKTELSEFSKYFDDIIANEEFTDHELQIKGKKALIDGKEAGFAIALSMGITKKSTSMPNVNKMCFDEFMLEKGNYHYITDEVTKFLGLYDSVFRLRDGVVFFLANAVSVSNPYFIYFNLQLPQNEKRIKAKDDILIQLVQDDEYIKRKNETRFGKIISGTEYGDYAIDNNFIADSSTFIEKRTPHSRYVCTVVFEGISYGVWTDYNAGLMFFTNKANLNYPVTLAFTTKDHKPNYLLLSNKRNSFIQFIFAGYERGAMRFENMNCKNKFLELYRMGKRA